MTRRHWLPRMVQIVDSDGTSPVVPYVEIDEGLLIPAGNKVRGFPSWAQRMLERGWNTVQLIGFERRERRVWARLAIGIEKEILWEQYIARLRPGMRPTRVEDSVELIVLEPEDRM
jgi:hypothetical protein